MSGIGSASAGDHGFIGRFVEILERHAGDALVNEVRGDALVPTTGAGLAAMIARARGTLRAHGVAPGDRVVLVAPNSTRWVAADLAVLFEGAIVVPLYARQAVPELVGMVHDCAPKLIVSDGVELGLGGEIPTITLDALVAGEPVSDTPVARAPGDLVTLIYTSGTSGEPKGVMYARSNVDFMLPVIAREVTSLLGSEPVDRERVFHYLPLCFAGSRMVLWMCLWRGTGILLSTDLANLKQEMATARPHYFLNVPALLERVRLGVEGVMAKKGKPIRALWEAGKAADDRARDGKAGLFDKAVLALARRVVFAKVRQQIGPALRSLICGSAALPAATQRWFERLGIPVYQVYGLTETTAIVTLDRPGQAVAGRVGWVVPGVETRLDDGELLVRGPNIFAGYWGRPDATRAAMTDDGWFRTGDKVDFDASGNMALIGRAKNLLVPESGHNVAPEPLEELILERLPGVEQAIVLGHARPYLVALVAGDVDVTRLDAALAAMNEPLPHYRRIKKIAVTPERWTPENGLLTANQKLRRATIETRFADLVKGLYQ
ncbi:MAG: AMP-binding protein [Deltaproteobacteria bacterium]|nr:AMP-binding protein [Deltaproteobacteria bacterium]